jgi:RNA polymerase sigma-70 factor (ECF subfamily)
MERSGSETDLSLIGRIRNPRDSEGWSLFVKLYAPSVRSLARQKGVHPNQLEDVVQEVLIRVAKAVQDFKLDHAIGKFRTWLWTLVHNTVMDHHRKRVRRPKEQCDGPEPVAAGQTPGDPDRDWLREHRLRAIQLAIQCVQKDVQPQTWSCFQEHVLKCRPAAEVAAELGLTANSVYVNASRVLAKVRKQCAEYMEDLGDDQDD